MLQPFERGPVAGDDVEVERRELLAGEFLLGDRGQVLGQLDHGVQLVRRLRVGQAIVDHALAQSAGQLGDLGIEGRVGLDVARRFRLLAPVALSRYRLLGIEDGVVAQFGPTAQGRVQALARPCPRLHEVRGALRREGHHVLQ